MRYQISDAQTGILLWEGDAQGEEEAFEEMAHEAGFQRFSAFKDVAGNTEFLIRRV
ncbi:hypothetical protein [Methylobacterium nodulans]|uniref:Uncharacterized protein n=1 Tax=Methylobacterium nodulans (strain LMG 21967 / CNCM I-2342 / ORS 2060) TaxID=460265 RepID=B8IAD5_METNO|nr:hypothetical protein [Methylobacterium nodulans]ACL59198.1 hypothetical protein Mnod_4322 [Methylobacterium nodulans ORS 2060]